MIIYFIATFFFVFQSESGDNNTYPWFIKQKWYHDMPFLGIENFHPLDPEDVKICGKNKCAVQVVGHGTRQLGRRHSWWAGAPPHVQRLLLPGNNGYFALRGKKTFSPLAGSFHRHNLAETSCTHDTENSFINETKMHTINRYCAVDVSSFAGRSIVFRERKRRKKIPRDKDYFLTLYSVVLFVPSAFNFT